VTRVLVAPDSYKGSMTSVAVARALADGWRRGRAEDEVTLAPLADGGEGTLDAVMATGDWAPLPASARDPLMRPIDARFLRRGERAVVELAVASGLSLVAPGERDADAATTFGTGQVLAAAIGLGCTSIVLGLGGSATTDGGAGLLMALGVRLLDSDGTTCPWAGRARDLEPSTCPSSPRCWPSAPHRGVGRGQPAWRAGRGAVYGPQKGPTRGVARLDAALAHFADVLEATTGRQVRAVPGAGAAGAQAGQLAIADRFAAFEVRRASTWSWDHRLRCRLAESDGVTAKDGWSPRPRSARPRWGRAAGRAAGVAACAWVAP